MVLSRISFCVSQTRYLVPFSYFHQANLGTAEEHQKIFKWLGNINHQKLQENGVTLRSNLKQQTGTWFLEGSKFTRWWNTKGAKLWVHGIRMCTFDVLEIPLAGLLLISRSNSGFWENGFDVSRESASKGLMLMLVRSTIIQHIEAQIQDSSIRINHDGVFHSFIDLLIVLILLALAYFYCDFREEKTKSAWNIIGSLIKQLAQQNRECLYDLEDFYRQHDPLGISTKPCNTEDLSQLLRQMARKFDGEVMIVIDGLDEIEEGRVETIELLKSLGTCCLPGGGPSNASELESDQPAQLNTPGTGTSSRTAIATVLENTSLLTDGGTEKGADIELFLDTTSMDSLEKEDSTCVKLLLVSPTLPDIETEFENFEKQIIKAEEKDLQLYVSSEIHHRMNKGTLRFSDRLLKDEIVDGLIENAQGM